MTGPKIVWGQVDVSESNWVTEYGPYLLIGALIILGLATSGTVGREKKAHGRA